MNAKIGLKLVCVLMVLGFGNIEGFTQSLYSSVVYQVTVPGSDIKETNDGLSPLGIGIEVGGFINQRLAIGLNVSWNIFREGLEKTGGILNKEEKIFISLMPVMVTIRYHLKGIDNGFAPFVGVGIGGNSVVQGKDHGFFTVASVILGENANGYFGIAPEVGFTLPFSSKITGLMKLKYNYVSEEDGFSPSYWGVNLGLLLR